MDERDLPDAIRSAILVAISIFIAFFYILTTWTFYDCYRQTQRGYLRQRSLSITLVSSCSGGVTCTLFLLHNAVVWSLIPSIITAVSTNVRMVDTPANCSVHWELFPLAVFVLFFTLFILPVTMYHVWGFKDMFYIRDDLVVVFLAGICLTIPFLIVKFILPENLVDSFFETLFIIAHLLVVQISSVTVPIWRSRVVYRFKGCHVLYSKDINNDLIVNPATYRRALQHAGPHLLSSRRDFKPLTISINGFTPPPSTEQQSRPSSATVVPSNSSHKTTSNPQAMYANQNPLFGVVQNADWFVRFQKYCADNFCAELPLFLMDYQVLKAKVLGYTVDHREPSASISPNPSPEVPLSCHEEGDRWDDGNPLPFTGTASTNDPYQSPFDIPLDHRPNAPRKNLTAPSTIQCMGMITDRQVPPLPVTIQEAYQNHMQRDSFATNSSLKPDINPFQPHSTTARPQSACVVSRWWLRSATECSFQRAKTGRHAKGGKQCQSLYLPTTWLPSAADLGSPPAQSSTTRLYQPDPFSPPAWETPQQGTIDPSVCAGIEGHQKREDCTGMVGGGWVNGFPNRLVPRQFHPLFYKFYQRYLAPGAHWEVNVDNSATHHAHRLFSSLEKRPRLPSAGIVIDGLCLDVFDEALNQVYQLLGQDLFPKFYLEHCAALKSLWANEYQVQPNEQAVVIVNSG
ncbi:hypothetical protein H4R34_002967 [Dimargaris verticillata]|uniref:RGS domain-containing protein n=1 Tax=Dimargaris verticillata TaxID=2761393 RepID=A0A9W8B0V8_9FUNG|nr:hypothetical protein H4R34_002967 [Dimargaris verticillata]